MLTIWRRKALPIIGDWLNKHNLGNWIAKPHQENLWKMSTNTEWVVNENEAYKKENKGARRSRTNGHCGLRVGE